MSSKKAGCISVERLLYSFVEAWRRVCHPSRMVSALICQSTKGTSRSRKCLLPVVHQTERCRVNQLWFSSCIPSSQVGHNLRYNSRIFRRQIKLALRPAIDISVEVIRIPDGAIPAISEEKFCFAFVWFQVADVQNPYPSCVTLYSNGKLFMNLWDLAALDGKLDTPTSRNKYLQ